MIRQRLALGLILVSALGANLASAQTRQFRIIPNGGSRASFTSEAPMETINGVSSHVSGTVTLNTANVSQTTGTVALDVASLRTGIDLRDEHIRGPNWLDAGAHPNITFEVTSIEGGGAIQPEVTVDHLRIHGRLTIKGTTHDVVAQGRFRLIPLNDAMRAAHINGDVLRIRALLTIRLSDYGVSIPAMVQVKVANEIALNVNIRAVANPS